MSDQQQNSQKKSESLNDLFISLRALENEIDESAEITNELCDAHLAHLQKIDEKVDRLLAYMDIAKRNAAMYAERAEELKRVGEKWEKRLQGLEDYALYLVDRFPDVAWRGTDRSFDKKLNAPSLIVPMKKKFSTDNVIPPEFINMVPESYRKPVTLFVLETKAVKDAMKNGAEFPFAKLERKTALKVSAKLKEDRT